MNPRLRVKEQSKDHFYHPDFHSDCQATPIPCKSPFQGKTHDEAGGPPEFPSDSQVSHKMPLEHTPDPQATVYEGIPYILELWECLGYAPWVC